MDTPTVSNSRFEIPITMPAFPVDKRLAFVQHVLDLMVESRFQFDDLDLSECFTPEDGTEIGIGSESDRGFPLAANGDPGTHPRTIGPRSSRESTTTRVQKKRTLKSPALTFRVFTKICADTRTDALDFKPRFEAPAADVMPCGLPAKRASIIGNQDWDAIDGFTSAYNSNLKSASCQPRGSPFSF